ncbi:MAG: hypothetical protein AB7O97_03670 [Planctomycetota bacterium]
MQLENIATPQEDTTPELRYASLHRAVERGMASDEVLRELAEICLQLGHHDEAVRVHGNMKAGPLRDHVASRLARRGLIHRASGPTKNSFDDTDFEDDGDPSIREHVLDSIQYLCQSHMPAVALLTMLAFPLVVGVGGFLTSGGSPWLFAGLAALPGLCVLGVVGAMGRQIFLQSADGEEEVPAIPAPTDMVQFAKRYLGDVLIVLGILVAPSLTLLWFEAPLVSSLPGLLLGMSLVPIALILRQIRGDIGALSPVALVRGIGCCKGYARVTAAFWMAFAPAAIAFWSSLGHAVYLQIAIVGPLAVLPTFATARLLGTFVEVHRSRLGLLLYPQGKVSAATTAKSTTSAVGNRPNHTPLRRTPARPAPARPAPARPAPQPTAARPAPTPTSARPTLGSTPAPASAPRRAPAARQAAPASQPALPKKPPQLERKAIDVTPQPGNLARRPQPEDWMAEPPKAPPRPAAHIEGRAPKQSPPARKAAEPKAQPARGAAPKADPMQLAKKQVKRAPTAHLEDNDLPGPDLSNIPGATIITGEDRERMGASSRRR